MSLKGASLLLWFAIGCGTAPKPAVPMKVDFAPFLERSGCTLALENYYNCPAGPAHDLGCLGLRRVDLLGGFAPGIAVAECGGGAVGPSARSEFIRTVGGGLGEQPGFVRLLVATPTGFELVRNFDELRERFAPVETPEEAMSFAIIASDAKLFDASWQMPAGYHRVAHGVPSTDVIRQESGTFVVRNLLFTYEGEMLMSPVMLGDVFVTRDGFVGRASQGQMLASAQ